MTTEDTTKHLARCP